ncbi:uncharacterized protein LOC143913154 [Arctopsyche grandis]|uniref:uncharacterized protein LOC143913154 n=1 Tax=Arctopsyche grandis TaxID=121162 RepID=UPI00406D9C74
MSDLNKVDSVEKAKTMIASGVTEYEVGKYPVAKIIFGSVLQFYRNHHGLKHDETVAVLKKLIDVERKLQNFKEVKVLLGELVSVHGDQDVKSVDAMLDLSDVEQVLVNRSEAKKWAEKCLQICEKTYNRKSLEVARVLVNLSHIESVANKSQAEKHLDEVVNTYQHICGNKDIRYGYALFNLGILQRDMAEYKKSKVSLTNAYSVFTNDNKCDEIETANVLLNLSTVTKILGEFSTAEKHVLDALKIYNKKYGEDNYRSVGLLINLSDIEVRMKRYENAKKSLEKVQNVFENLYGPEHINTAHILFNLSKVEMKLNHVKQSKKLLERVLQVYEVCYKHGNINTTNVLLDLIMCEKSLKNYNKAEELLNKVIPIYRTQKSDIDTSEIMFLMSRVQINLGKYREAKTLLTEIKPTYEKKYGTASVELANILLNLSAVEKGLHNYPLSKIHLNQILAKCDLTPVLKADVKMNMSNIEIENENYLEAKKLVTEAMEIYKNYKMDLRCASAWLNLSNIEKDLGNYTSSREHLENVLTKYKTQYGPSSIETAEVMVNLSNVKNDLGEYDKESLEKVISIFEEHYGPDHFETARIRLNLSNVKSEIGIYERAKAKVLKISNNNGNSDSLDIPKDIIDDGINHGLTNFQEVKCLLERVLAAYKEYFGPDHHKTAGVLLSMSNVEVSLGNYTKAMEYLDKILPIFEHRYGTEHTETTGVYLNMSIAESSMGNYAKAKDYLDRVFKSYNSINVAPNHPLYITAEFNLAKIENKMNNRKDAKTLLEKILPLYEKCYGVKHLKIGIILLHIVVSCEDSEDKNRFGKRLKFFSQEIRDNNNLL